MVLLTCSTLGPAAALARAGVPVLRVDAALAQEAVRGGGDVVVLCATATTLEPTRALFEDAARGTGARVAVRLVPGAWAAFLAGDQDGYWALVAEAADAAAAGGPAGDRASADGCGAVEAGVGRASSDAADRVRVVLAQASMAGAAVLARCRPLTSPAAGLRAALQAAGAVRG